MSFTIINQINWLAVLVATLPSMVLGFVYFGVVFGKTYAAILGRSFDPKAKPAPIFIVGPLVCTLVTNIANSMIMKALGIASIGDAVIFGTLVGVGYLVATMTNVAINPNMPHPLRYAVLNAPYFLAINVIACAILASM
jgi:hypothetical protein